MSKIARRNFIVRSFALLGLGILSGGDAFGAIKSLDAEFLKQELRVKTDAEAAFVDDVVAKAKKGELPVNILDAAYRYSMKKSMSRRVFYFSQCLKILTQRANIRIKFLSF